MSKSHPPQIKKQEVWYTHIGDNVGKCKCFCCNFNDITMLEFHCGHIQAKSKGGSMSINNIVPIYSKCNLSIGNINMMDFMEKLNFYSLHFYAKNLLCKTLRM